MDKRKLLQELKYALPNHNFFYHVNLCAIKIGNEYFVLKDRYEGNGGYVTKNLDESLLLDYKQIEPIGHKYTELIHKSVLIDKRILHRKGLDAIIEYLESKEIA